MEKRTLIALALSFLVLAGYPYLLKQFYPDYYKKQDAAKAAPAPEVASSEAEPEAPSKTFLKTAEVSSEDDVAFKNGKLELLFNKKDGGIREIAFPAYRDAQTKAPIRFISLKKAGVSPGSLAVSSGGDVSAVSDHAITQEGPTTMTQADALGGKLRVEKTLKLRDGYAGELLVTITNVSSQPLDLRYELVAGSGVKPRNSIDPQYIEGNFFSMRDGKPKLQHVKEDRPGHEKSSDGAIQWIAIKDRHFNVALKPKSGEFSGKVRGLGGQDMSVSLVSGALSLVPGASHASEFTVYIGPNELAPLSAAGLGEMVNFGKFDIIGKLMVGALELLHKIFRNYGLAIVMLTALINLLLFPLTRVSYMSMKRMQLVQPQMTKLREQHKKNPEKLNKEMMELYKRHKVNPFGGCMPMLLQIPIFIALYVALSKYVPLIGAGFLWVDDLSAPDRVYLPFSLPFLGNSIHLLPLLMCVAMFLQQKFTQIKIEGQDPAMEQQQKIMAWMMPIVFGFIFYQMPSGLVVYWLTNTLLMAAYQLKLKNMTLA